MINRRKFFKKTAEQKLNDKKSKEEIRKEIIALTQSAKACLSDVKFKKYEEQYLNSRENIISILERYEEPDPIKYALFCRESLSMLLTLRQLLDSVKVDARDKVEVQEEEDAS